GPTTHWVESFEKAREEGSGSSTWRGRWRRRSAPVSERRKIQAGSASSGATRGHRAPPSPVATALRTTTVPGKSEVSDRQTVRVSVRPPA
ncbi:unnamed protein product, partial [Rangifer tarandus platyrhynchus]